ncbi:MAG: Uma2 family endonuclease [Saprospiraceae bacterium]|nr:Uma2 family endonuclease [Saprospiraceae bacterium]
MSAAAIAKEHNVFPKISFLEKIYTLEEYLAFEERSPHKHEFYNGKIVRMSKAKAKHNQIAANLTGALKYAVRPLPNRYIVYNSDQKVYIEVENKGVYPDTLVVCERPQFWKDNEEFIVNPILVVEVASRSTRAYDRSDKFMLYQKLSSFKEYVLVEQNRPHVESWCCIKENTWEKTIETDLQKSIALRSLGVQIDLAEIYEYVDFLKT